MTAPTAKVTAMTFDQRCASVSASSSPRTPSQLAMSTISGKAIPMQAKGMWKASVNAICSRAASRFEVDAAITPTFLSMRRSLG